MDKKQINHFELYSLLTLFIISNDMARGLYTKHLKQDLWIAILMGYFFSILIINMYFVLFKNMKYMSFSEMMESVLGKFFSRVIFVIYPFYFIYLASLCLRDLEEMVRAFLIDQAPSYMLGGLLMIAIFIAVNAGLEVISRVGILLLRFLIITFFLIMTLLLSFEKLHLDNLKPILEVGYTPILRYSFYMSYGIPFGELFIFLLIIHHLSSKKKLLKTFLLGHGTGAFILLCITILNLLILGPTSMDYGITPFVRISRRIDIENFMQRFDLITILVLVCSSYIKLSLLTYGANHCISQIIKIKEKIVYFILCASILILANRFKSNYILLIMFREKVGLPYIKLVFELVIPLILFVLSFFRKPKENQKSNEEKENKSNNKKRFTLLKH